MTNTLFNLAEKQHDVYQTIEVSNLLYLIDANLQEDNDQHKLTLVLDNKLKQIFNETDYLILVKGQKVIWALTKINNDRLYSILSNVQCNHILSMFKYNVSPAIYIKFRDAEQITLARTLGIIC